MTILFWSDSQMDLDRHGHNEMAPFKMFKFFCYTKKLFEQHEDE